jgi:hypothetical protein
MTLPQLLLAILLYWVLALTIWVLRTRQAGRREMSQAMEEAMTRNPGQAEFTVEVSSSIDLNQLAAIAVIPPLLATIAWLVLR